MTLPHVLRRMPPIVAVWCLTATAGCGALAPLAQVVQPPRFDPAGRPIDIRLLGASATYPAGGAGLTFWIEATNPNPFGFTLTTLAATLRLDGRQAAVGDFPLGLPLGAGQTTVVPLDLTISFAELPGLDAVLRLAASGAAVTYELEGIAGIDVGRLGRSTFGPILLARGQLHTTAVL